MSVPDMNLRTSATVQSILPSNEHKKFYFEITSV